jgi:hypothetical protein
LTRLRAVAAATALILLVLLTPPVSATPTANDDATYGQYGRVFPDPLAACNGSPVCSPNAQGNVPATQFIQFNEFLSSIRYMNGKFSRFMEVLPLDGKLGDGNGTGKAPDVPGNNMPNLEFVPKPEYQSAGLAQTGNGRKNHDLIVVRVTDETVPDAGKKRYALSLSIHGIERAGIEGGTRAMEDLVTAAATNTSGTTVVPRDVDPNAPTFAEVLKSTIIYFTYPNPDGWQRGSVVPDPNGGGGGVFFQRYNGNGVDLNRDWPDIGFTFRPYSGLSEPESRALAAFFDQVKVNGGKFFAGDDLHGQPLADALSYTLLPHGSHPFDKDIRIRETAKTIHENSEKKLSWSPLIQPNNAPQGGDVGCAPDTPVGTPCQKIYGQTWGSVYDTINYTTTGALGDYFDSSVGLGADGIDNEMSFSHLDKNITFDPHTEQLHVDGNKALIYAHIAEIVRPAVGLFDAPGRKGYVPNKRLKRGATDPTGAPAGSKPHDPIDIAAPQPDKQDPAAGGIVLDIGDISGDNVFNGGMRVDVRTANVQGIGTGTVTVQVQCQFCDRHRSKEPKGEEGEWVTVAEDYNQSPVYLQAGVTAAVNEPQSDKKTKWRVVVSPQAGVPSAHVEFSSGPATTDGNTGGDNPPRQRAYDVANTDFFRELDKHVVDDREDFDTLDPGAVIAGRQSLGDFESVVLADDPLPGYTGSYGGRSRPTGAPTKEVAFNGSASPPGADLGPGAVPGSTGEHEFTIGENDANKSATIRVDWAQATNDFDVYVDKVEADGSRTRVGESASAQGTTNFEQLTLEDPSPGKYIVQVFNYLAFDPAYTGKVTFAAAPAASTDTGEFTTAQKDTWAKKLREYVDGGGNLVLTDGSLRILPEVTGIPEKSINRQTVYAGQIAFGKSSSESTVKDRLARNIDQPGARFNGGFRRQMYEPTPLGFAIQDPTGADEANAVQYDVDRAAWEKIGGRTAGGSADSGTRSAAAVYDRVALGEWKSGKGQVRIAGALLPQPTDKFDHPFGLEPYATTYSGYIVLRNLLDTTARGLPGLPGSRDNPAPGDAGARGSGLAGGSNTGRNFVISRRAVKLKKKRAAVRVSCRSVTGCRGTLKLTLRQSVRGKNGKKRVRTITLGKAKFNYPAKKRNALLKVKLTSKTARAASTKRRQKVSAVASVRFGDRSSGRSNAKFWLYRPARGG